MSRILVIDDQAGFLSLIAHVLQSKGYEVKALTEGPSALTLLQSEAFDLVICDIWMQPMGGMDILRRIRKPFPDLPVVMLTGRGSVETALESLNLGAFDYITKPFEMADMIWTVERALEQADCADGAERIPEIVYGPGQFVINSTAMQALMNTMRRLAPTEIPLLISGEKGVGKRRVASAVHDLAGRTKDSYFELNCADLTAEVDSHHSGGGMADAEDTISAASGTVCFVNVEMLPASFQQELLDMLKRRISATQEDHEALQRITVGPRVIATTAVNITKYVEQGLFDRELFERLNRFSFRVPPLRERRQDILPLTHHFLRDLSGAPRLLDADVRALLEHYDWPGNVDELSAVVDGFAAVAPGASIARERLPAALQKTVPFPSTPVPSSAKPSARGRWLRDFLQARNDKACEVVNV
ncbi:MAG: response regulator [Lentisphaerae bacterium]|nr:response regulator [Lentisphaerota bacterium]